nr:transposase [Pseudomonas sp. Fl4BN1]
MGPEGCSQIEAVAMDMNTAFNIEVRQHCPQARVVYDLFHVVANTAVKSLIVYESMRPCSGRRTWLFSESLYPRGEY